MNLKWIFGCLLLFTVLDVANAQRCPSGQSVRVRRSWHDLSTSAKREYSYCVRRIYSSGHLWRMCNKHRAQVNTAHFNDYFLPFHRCFLKEWELLLDAYGCRGWGVPYWDASQEFNNWWLSPIWQYFGNLGGAAQGTNRAECVNSGWYNGILDPSRNCVRREGSRNPVYSSTSVSNVINTSNDFGTYTERSEFLQHAQVHIQIDGHMNSLALSACDPIFYSHHAAIDYHWSLWQSRSPAFYSAYTGDRSATAPGFEWYGWNVDSCIRYRELDCFRYEPPSSATRVTVGSAWAGLVKRTPVAVPGPVAHPVIEAGPLSKRQDDDDEDQDEQEEEEESDEESEIEESDEEEDIEIDISDESVGEGDSEDEPEVSAADISADVDESEDEVEQILEEIPDTPPVVEVPTNPEEAGSDPFPQPQDIPDSWCEENGADCGRARSVQDEEAESIEILNEVKDEEGGIPEDSAELAVIVQVEKLDKPQEEKRKIKDVWTAKEKKVKKNP